MANNTKRKLYTKTNKYQQRIISLSFIPALVICITVTMLLEMFYLELVDVVLYGAKAPIIQLIYKWSAFILLSIWVCFLCVHSWSYFVSTNLVGAFERVLKELDEVISGEKKGPIKSRAKDDLANEVLKRVNVLIDKASNHKE